MTVYKAKHVHTDVVLGQRKSKGKSLLGKSVECQLIDLQCSVCEQKTVRLVTA